MNKKYNYLLPFMFALMMAIGMIFGQKIYQSNASKPSLFSDIEQNKVEEILNLLEVKYVDTINQSEILDNLINDIIGQLDPHSFYITQKQLKSINEDLVGEFEGIGVEFYIVNDTVIVVSPISGGPSEALGILAGDKIVKIEDTTIAGIGFTNEDVVSQLRGEKGTEVKVSIYRPGVEELLDYNIIRDKIPIQSVDVAYMVDSLTGYIKINRFSEKTHTEFLKQLQLMNEKGLRKLIIDVRENPGGLLGQATMIADEVLNGNKLIVYTKGKAYDKNDYKANLPGEFEEGEVAIIINQGSASASEIIAGAIQDWDRGVVVGRRSFGKGLVQEQYNLKDGSALRLTVARYYTPSGRCIQKPYTNGHSMDYEREIFDRIKNGELVVDDSVNHGDTLKYYTENGRTVFGGGGIMPDIFVPIDTNRFDLWSNIRIHLPQFAYSYYAKNISNFKDLDSLSDYVNNYLVSEYFYTSFLTYIEQKEINISNINPELRTRLETYLKAYIARQIWHDEGFYQVLNQIDPAFNEAYNIVHNRKKYKAILKGKKF